MLKLTNPLVLVPVPTIRSQNNDLQPHANAWRLMNQAKNIMAFLFLLFSWNSAKSEVTIANFQTDYLAGNTNGQTRAQRSADGWNYMYGPSGSLGTASTYVGLTWNGSEYNKANNIPSVFGSSPNVRVHPADGFNLILAYTIQSGEQGYISIANSEIRALSGNGITYSIFVDNTQNGTTVAVPGSSSNWVNFNRDLGYLNAGQTVYVAVGAGSEQSSDETQINYSLVSAVPEPSTYLLCGMSTAALAAMMYFHTRRKQRERLALIAASAE